MHEKGEPKSPSGDQNLNNYIMTWSRLHQS